MESLSSLATEKSVQLDTSKHSLPDHAPSFNAPSDNSHILSKIKAHLDFTQTEFLRNIDWQKQLIAQINDTNSKVTKERKSVRESEGFRLSSDQQSKLKMVLQRILGESAEGLSLRELIEKAYSLRNSRLKEAHIFSSGPHDNPEEKLQFPNVQRIITLNDLAPSTQRQISASPPSLPPRTPKSKAKKANKENISSKNLLCWTPQQQQMGASQETEKYQTDGRKIEDWKRDIQLILEDSLGKRLFHDDREAIYIEESVGEDKISSQVSLNLSISNGGSRGQVVGRVNTFQPKKIMLADARKSGNFEKESIYLRMSEFISENDENMPISKSSSQNASIGQEIPQGFLCFREPPKRRLGKCVVRKEHYYSYESDVDSLRKLHDSFGHAYQQYYLCQNVASEDHYPCSIADNKLTKNEKH